MIQTIANVLKKKGDFIATVQPEETVYSALEHMAAKDVGAVLVMDGEKLSGIFSEREYARKVILEGRSSLKTPVAEIMSSGVVCVRPDMKIEEGLGLMTKKRCRHLPVVEGDKVVGIVSIGDLVHATISNQEFKIGQLESYILSD